MDTDSKMSASFFYGSNVLISGGTGSLGTALVSILHLRHHPKRIICYSRDEQKQFAMQQQLGEIIPELRLMLGDVRDYDRLRQVCEGADYVINAAAYKHIPACEYAPLEAVKTNVLGAANVVRACLACGVQRAIQVSTDKVPESATLYGATKFCAERLFLAANNYNKTKFRVCRYANVIGSRGSVVETFLNLKSQGIHEFPITSMECTRFWMPITAAVEVVLGTLMGDAAIGIPLVRAMKITDVARAIDPDCTFKIIGLRPGEKLHECLVSPHERVPGCEGGYYSNTAPQMTIEEFKGLAGI